MRLTAKTTVALLAAFCALLVAYGLYELKRQTGLAEGQMRESQRMLGRMFVPSIAKAWRMQSDLNARYVIEYTEQILNKGVETPFDLRWVWLDAPEGDSLAPLASRADLAPVAANQELTLVLGDDGTERMVTYVPVPLDMEDAKADGKAGALELSASLATIREFARDARRRLLITVAAGAGALAILSLSVGAWFVGRPVRKVVEATRKIGRGELTTRVRLKRRRDELGTIADAIDAMAMDLALMRDLAERETEARIQAGEQLRHADRLVTVGKLASGMAHELGTPLAVVAGRAKLIANRTVVEDEVITYAKSIERQSDKMAQIIRQLLDFARRRTVTLTSKDINALVRQTIELLGTVAHRHKVKLEADLPEARQDAPVDGFQIQQVLTNLVMNAIQATPEGGNVTVRVRERDAEPPPTVSSPGGTKLCIEVEDTGAGMPKEVLSRVFEPFFTTKPVGQGTGLGLAVAHGIVAEHGGWIAAESELGVGSRFLVYLPLRIEESCQERS